MHNDNRLTIEELTEEQIEAVLNTRGFRKMLAYQRLASGIDVLADEDEIYQSLVTSITKQHKNNLSEDSVRECLRLFRVEVETFTEPLVDVDGDEGEVELSDLDSLVVDDS